jgi:hypothetical protein
LSDLRRIVTANDRHASFGMKSNSGKNTATIMMWGRRGKREQMSHRNLIVPVNDRRGKWWKKMCVCRKKL